MIDECFILMASQKLAIVPLHSL